MFKAPGQDAGCALAKDGELVDVFSNSGVKRLGEEAFVEAASKAAREPEVLDCCGVCLLEYN
jgi:hypothetical protein